MTNYDHPPGHPQSVADGCQCPTLVNGHGAGCGYSDANGHPLYVVDQTCPLHGNAPQPAPGELFNADSAPLGL